MWRIYIIGILYGLTVFNIPEIREDTIARVQLYTPTARAKIAELTNKYQPAFLSIVADLNKVAKTRINGKVVDQVTKQPVDTTDTFNIRHKSSITGDQFDNILRDYGSPAIGVGTHVVAYGNEKNVDAAYALYMFIRESTAGTNKEWAGIKPGGDTTHNPGNIICAGYSSCYNGFRDYATWEEGFDGLIDLLVSYNEDNDIQTMREAIARWAPASDGNDPVGYADSLEENVRKWRALNTQDYIAVTTTELGITESVKPVSTFTLPADKEIRSSTLPLGGCLSDTVPNALNPSPSLQEFSVASGQDWIFNDNWIIIDPDSHSCGGVPYGGICDMASQYQIVAKQLGFEREYGRHPNGLNGIDYDDTVVIWSGGPNRGGDQDLRIINTTGKTAHFRATIENGSFTVSGWLE